MDFSIWQREREEKPTHQAQAGLKTIAQNHLFSDAKPELVCLAGGWASNTLTTGCCANWVSDLFSRYVLRDVAQAS